jgi:hypothetical protein
MAPAEFADFIRLNTEKWIEIAAAAGLKAN